MVDAILIPLGVLGWVLAAAMLGLWLGERGRRAAAERMLTWGSPEGNGRRRAVARAPAQEAEDRFLAKADALTKDTVARGIEEVRAHFREIGQPFDEKQWRRDIEAMVAGNDVPGDGE